MPPLDLTMTVRSSAATPRQDPQYRVVPYSICLEGKTRGIENEPKQEEELIFVLFAP